MEFLRFLRQTYKDFFEHIHLTHIPTLTISLVCIGTLLTVKYVHACVFFSSFCVFSRNFLSLLCRYLINENKKIMSWIRFPVPTELLVVIFGSLASYLMGLHDRGVATVREIPKGMPPPQVPSMMLIPDIIFDCLPIAVVSGTQFLSLFRTLL